MKSLKIFVFFIMCLATINVVIGQPVIELARNIVGTAPIHSDDPH